MVRARIRLDTLNQVVDFVKQLNQDGSINKYVIEDRDGRHRVNARSYLGVVYASSEFGDFMYLVNETEDGVFPASINIFRHPGEDGNFIHD